MPTKVYRPAESYLLTVAKIEKPGLRYVLPGVQAMANEIFVGVAYADVARGSVPSEVIDEYLQFLNSKLTEFSQFGVEVSNNEIIPGRAGIIVEATLKGKGGERTFSETVSANAPVKFTEDWAESVDIAAKRYARYTQTLTAEDWNAIRETAVRGYQSFIGEAVSPKHRMAVIKHAIGLGSVDPEYYLQRIRESVEKYKMGYEMAKMKFDRKQNVVIAGLAAARKFVEAFALAF
ncbi:MAG: hypothetical protein QW607_06265 [Desulfurococcaceae archaeon]